MTPIRRVTVLLAPIAALGLFASLAEAQAVTLTNRAISARNSFFENTGVSFGFGVGGSSMSAGLGGSFSQGSSRSFGSTSVSGTTMSGVPLRVNAGLQRPFVTSVIPNAAYGPGSLPATIPSAPPQRPRLLRGNKIVRNGQVIQLTDEQAAALKARPSRTRSTSTVRSNRTLQRALSYLQKARTAELSGRASVARSYYQRAMTTGNADVQRVALARLAVLPAR